MTSPSAAGRDLARTAAAAVTNLREVLDTGGCPNDTDGDGHCAAWRTCPWCGPDSPRT